MYRSIPVRAQHCGEIELKFIFVNMKQKANLFCLLHDKEDRLWKKIISTKWKCISSTSLSPDCIFSIWGRSGVAKVSCILRHQGVQLILAYSWARPAVLAAGMGRGGMFNFFYTFIHFPLSLLSLSFISSTISSISLLPFSGRRHKMTHKGWRVVKPQHSQSVFSVIFSFLFKDIQSSTAYNDLISYVP